MRVPHPKTLLFHWCEQQKLPLPVFTHLRVPRGIEVVGALTLPNGVLLTACVVAPTAKDAERDASCDLVVQAQAHVGPLVVRPSPDRRETDDERHARRAASAARAFAEANRATNHQALARLGATVRMTIHPAPRRRGWVVGEAWLERAHLRVVAGPVQAPTHEAAEALLTAELLLAVETRMPRPPFASTPEDMALVDAGCPALLDPGVG